MNAPRATSPGYSLVELLVVLAIMALVVLVAVPTASSTIERMTLSADARTLTTELRALRTIALDRQTDIVVTAGAGGLVSSQGAAIALSSGTAIEIAPNGSESAVVLRWDGTASGAVTLRRGRASMRIAVDRLTGRLAVGGAS
ncbi:MAG: prepilin-type N-terminal cleavage/methylation domain-containing protein [Alphaproteobacteria bacterium]|nr:prepilin-type N-terminal cleavage/methylation domain-containing protein [Alphaproteobacteria bacterium]